MTEPTQADTPQSSWGSDHTSFRYISRRAVVRSGLALVGIVVLCVAAVFTLRPLSSTENKATDAQAATAPVVVPAHLEVNVGKSALIALVQYGEPVSVSVISPSSSALAAQLRLSGTALRFDGVPVGVYELVVVFSSGSTLELTATVR